jgi:hypothetical protein
MRLNAKQVTESLLSPELDAACEAYWNDLFADGWSWREMIGGRAGNNTRERELGQHHALEIAHAIQCAINAFSKAKVSP